VVAAAVVATTAVVVVVTTTITAVPMPVVAVAGLLTPIQVSSVQ
jgi:hypothetical protein